MHLSQLSCASFFAIGFAKDPSSDTERFKMIAPVAMGMDPALDSDLIAIAKNNGWAEPVAGKSVRKDLADSEEVGGSVHMQPLMPVNQSLDGDYNGLDFAGSSTLKTVASKSRTWQLHIAAGNVLHVLSHSSVLDYFYIRSFEDGKVNRYDLRNGDSVKVPVQHGDVIFMNWQGRFASIISEKFYCTGLSEKERFECIKSFCYATARHSMVEFVAIVQNDGHGEWKGSEVKVEMGGEVKDEDQVESVEEELQEA